MASIPPLRRRQPTAAPSTDPDWLERPVFVVEPDCEREATGEEIAEISQPVQPEHVRIERRADGTSRTLILEWEGYRQGEMFGESNESQGPQFKVADTPKAREGFDELTRSALEQSGATLETPDGQP